LCIDKKPQAAAHEGMIIRDQDANLTHSLAP
jgi:hypothetical protein